ncbi:hypothetical protein [Aurantimonas endophytica]|uniref:TnsA endonuclease-like protein n=1 Tax=Aurantimonas endophytica TaxID=1522175 RepID=A0A7W6MMT4_9HYPH|nr:hypothetical protein [Aurantimonas endophytica]MBB4001190.1 hypothetical protein [Aurantimonas endophytica]MCO6403156.1 hypothetical protein [Aurantimonas endophytica]
MSERHVIQHLRERRLGISSYDKPLPDGPIYLAPDRTTTGRFETVEGEVVDHLLLGRQRRDELVWFGCEPTSASRIPVRRTKRSFRLRMNDLIENREKVTESMIEFAFLRIKREENRFGRIFDQPPARHFVRPDGSDGSHTFDFLVEEPDGSVIAYAVRPEAKVDEKLDMAIRCIREQSLAGFADAAVIVTERFITKARLHNANEILDSREHRNASDVAVAGEFVKRIRCGVMFHDLVEALRLGPRGRTAILCLVDDGILDFVQRERLTAATLLRPALTPTALN